MNLIGQSFGRYHILEQLGEGGMATVYRAYDTRLDADVAVKVIRRSAFPPDMLEQVLKRFEREAKSLAKLSHANIVGIIDYGDYEGAPYLVMEYLPGGTLKDKLGHPISYREAARLLLPIARALDFAHRKGMAHRDVKPSNILITADGDPMLTDFGIAKILEAQEGATLTGTGVGIGTPEYMAPEQWTGQAGPSSDIYSLGVVFYEMLTGRKPYTADTPAAVLLKQASDPLPDPRTLVPDLPDQAERVLLRALAKKPEDRFASMAEFATALENLRGEQTQAALHPAAVLSVAEMPATDLKTMAAVEGKGASSETVIAAPSADRAETKESTGKPKSVGKDKPPGKRSWLWAVAGIGALGVIALAFFLFKPFGNNNAAQNIQPTLPQPVAAAIKTDPPTNIPPTSNPPTAIPYTPKDCVKPEVFCVGLVTDVGKVDDKSFNQTAWEGLKLAEKDVGAKVQYIETTDAKDYDKNIAAFADEGYDAIVTVGFNLTEATYAAAKKYPNTKFIGIDQFLSRDNAHPDWPLSNLVSIVYNEDQSGFLVGALAAMMSTTHKIGAVCGTDVVPPVWRYGEGYKAGAAYADAQMGTTTKVSIVYHNDVGFDKTFTDPEWGATTANSMMDKGVDTIFGCGGKTGNGAVDATAQRGMYAIGVDTDQYYTLPEAAARMLSSAMKPETQPVAAILKLAKDGKFPTGGLFVGPSGFAPYHDLDSQVPADVKSKMDAILAGLQDGSLKTNVPPVKP